MYQFAVPLDSPRHDAFTRLTALATSRAGRLSLLQKLKPRDQTRQERVQALQRYLAEAQQSLQVVKRNLQLAAGARSRDSGTEKRGQPLWRKAM